MMRFYNLPGRAIAELWYLWPKKGEVWASARRRSHPFVHFLYSTLLYLGVMVIGVSIFSKSDASQMGVSSASGNQSISEFEAEQVTLFDGDAYFDENAEQSVTDELIDDLPPKFTLPDLSDSNALSDAKRAAFVTGEASRWSDRGFEGYAVPSEAEPESGCRNVYFTLDNMDGWQSPTELLCP